MTMNVNSYFGVLGFSSGRVLAVLYRWLAGSTWFAFYFFQHCLRIHSTLISLKKFLKLRSVL